MQSPIVLAFLFSLTLIGYCLAELDTRSLRSYQFSHALKRVQNVPEATGCIMFGVDLLNELGEVVTRDSDDIEARVVQLCRALRKPNAIQTSNVRTRLIDEVYSNVDRCLGVLDSSLLEPETEGKQEQGPEPIEEINQPTGNMNAPAESSTEDIGEHSELSDRMSDAGIDDVTNVSEEPADESSDGSEEEEEEDVEPGETEASGSDEHDEYENDDEHEEDSEPSNAGAEVESPGSSKISKLAQRMEQIRKESGQVKKQEKDIEAEQSIPEVNPIAEQSLDTEIKQVDEAVEPVDEVSQIEEVKPVAEPEPEPEPETRVEASIVSRIKEEPTKGLKGLLEDQAAGKLKDLTFEQRLRLMQSQHDQQKSRLERSGSLRETRPAPTPVSLETKPQVENPAIQITKEPNTASNHKSKPEDRRTPVEVAKSPKPSSISDNSFPPRWLQESEEMYWRRGHRPINISERIAKMREESDRHKQFYKEQYEKTPGATLMRNGPEDVNFGKPRDPRRPSKPTWML